MKHLITKVLSLILVFSLLVASNLNVSAYQLLATKGMVGYKPLTIYVAENTPAIYINTLKQAMETWNSTKYGTFFKYGGTIKTFSFPIEDNISVFQVGYYPPPPGRFCCGGTRVYVTDSKYIKETDIVINGNYPYFSSEATEMWGKYDLLSVITHELGHSLGLGESDVEESVMNQYFETMDTSKRILKQDDLNGLAHLYRPDVVNPDPSVSNPE